MQPSLLDQPITSHQPCRQPWAKVPNPSPFGSIFTFTPSDGCLEVGGRLSTLARPGVHSGAAGNAGAMHESIQGVDLAVSHVETLGRNMSELFEIRC